MGEVNLLFGRKMVITNSGDDLLFGLTVDAVISETHSYKNSVTRFPVEEGLDITDHIRQEPETLKIDGWISAAPLDDVPGTDRWLEAYSTLLSFAGRNRLTSTNDKTKGKKPILIDVVSGTRVWTDMAIENLDIPRDAQTGDAIHFEIDLVNIRKASTQDININFVARVTGATGSENVENQGQPNVNNGKQQPQEPEFDPDDSWLLSISKWVTKRGVSQDQAVKEIMAKKYGLPNLGD